MVMSASPGEFFVDGGYEVVNAGATHVQTVLPEPD
jgi:hypothetical protein